MTDDGKWHVMPVKELAAKKTAAPPKPAQSQSMEKIGSSAGITYAHVHFTGNYGANFCGEYQEHDEYQINQDSAHEIAWSLYGTCGHNIYYYDASGNLINQE
jgi:hypothetical protein